MAPHSERAKDRIPFFWREKRLTQREKKSWFVTLYFVPMAGYVGSEEGRSCANKNVDHGESFVLAPEMAFFWILPRRHDDRNFIPREKGKRRGGGIP